MTDHLKEDLNKYLKEPYSRILIPDEESSTFTAEILEFPGCIAQGNTPQEAYERLEETAKAWIEAALELGQEVPPPSVEHGYGGKIALRLPKSLHRQVAMAARRDGTSLNQFIVAAIAEKLGAHNLYERLRSKMLWFSRTDINEAMYDLGQYRLIDSAGNSTPPPFSIPKIDFKKEVAGNA